MLDAVSVKVIWVLLTFVNLAFPSAVVFTCGTSCLPVSFAANRSVTARAALAATSEMMG
jgi:phage shock protein PspC (stress-responsive transcriptional regulator)